MPIDNNEYIELLKESNITALGNLIKGREQNCCGVVKFAKPVRLSGGVDYVLAMAITDPTLGWNYTMAVNLFEPKTEAFASLNAGDLIVFKSLLIHEFYGKKQGRNLKKITTWAIVDRKTLEPRENDIIKLEMTETEQKAVEMLSTWSQENTPAELEAPPPQNASIIHGTSRNRITIMTEQIESYKGFFDYLGEVVSCKKLDGFTPKSNMFVTDYTKNPRPPPGDWFEGTIPPDRLIPVTLWNEHSEGCPPLKPGDFVFLENLKAKTSAAGNLEVTMRGEQRENFSKRCRVKKLSMDDIFVKAIIERREKYLSDTKRSRPASSAVPEIKLKQIISVIKDIKQNFMGISDILNDTTIPSLYKLRAKVVDYRPFQVNDWVRKWCSACDKSYPPTSEQCRECKTPIDQYIFQGVLLLEDIKQDKMILYVYGEDSRNMFTDFVPAEPTQEHIAELEKKLKVMYSADQRLEMGVKSYVVPGRGRHYRITNTQITFC